MVFPLIGSPSVPVFGDICVSNGYFISNSPLSFPIFEWKDVATDSYWALITNNSLKEQNFSSDGLFKNVPSYTVHHLVPEHKDVDYFLKIELEDEDMEEHIIKSILAIPKVITAYTIATNNLKSKNNLIF